MDDTLRYLTREVVGSDLKWGPARAKSGTLDTNGCNVVGDFGAIVSRSTALSLTDATASAGTSLLTTWISTGWCHLVSEGCLDGI